MADYQQIKLTRSGVSGAIPTSGDLELGELALNYADGKLFYKDSTNTIDLLNSTYNNSGQKIYVNELNNHVGLSTIAPEFLLDLGGAIGSVDNSIRLNQEGGGTAIRIGTATSADVTLLRVDTTDGESNSAQFGFSLKYMGSGATNNDALSIFSDNQTGTAVQALTVLQDGKVGINTPTPVAELDVTGDVEVSGTINSNAVTTTDITATGVVDLTINTINIAAGAVTPGKLSTGAPTWTENGELYTNQVIGREDADSLILRADPQSPTPTTGGSQIELYSADHGQGTGGVPNQIYVKSSFVYFDTVAAQPARFAGINPNGPTDAKDLTTKEYVDQQMVRNITHVLKTDSTTIASVVEGTNYVIDGLTTPAMTLRNTNPTILIDSMISVGQQTSNQSVVVWITYELNESGAWNTFNMPDTLTGVDSPAYGHSASNVADLNEDINTIPIKQVLSLTAPAGTTIRYRANVTNFYVDGNENPLWINRSENDTVAAAGGSNRGRVTSMILAEELY